MFGALAQAYGGELGDRADGLRAIAANEIHSGHECGGHRAHTASEHAELSLWRCDVRGPAHEFGFPLGFYLVRIAITNRRAITRGLNPGQTGAPLERRRAGKVQYHAESARELQMIDGELFGEQL